VVGRQQYLKSLHVEIEMHQCKMADLTVEAATLNAHLLLLPPELEDCWGSTGPLLRLDVAAPIPHVHCTKSIASDGPPDQSWTFTPLHPMSDINPVPGGTWPPHMPTHQAAAPNLPEAPWPWNMIPPMGAPPALAPLMPLYAPYPFQQPYPPPTVPPLLPPVVERERGPKVKESTSFTGTDPTKLQEFLAQCLLTFNAEPRHYQKDEAQVMFAASYLTEAAASWFQPFLLVPICPSILSDWPEFISKLTQMFGDPHLASTSERKLQTLHMRDNHYVNCYLVDFMKYSADRYRLE